MVDTVNGKIVTGRLGQANESVTHQIYTHPSTGQDRPAAEMIARLIARALGAGEAELCPPGHKSSQVVPTR